MKIQLLVLDLDGTLADTSLNIAKAANAALAHVDLPLLPTKTIVEFIGGGSKKLLQKCFDFHCCDDRDLYRSALEFLYQYYYENIHKDTHLYDEVAETLKLIQCPKAVLTNKPGKMAHRLLEFFGIHNYFSDVIAPDVVELLKPNPHHLLQLMEKYRVSPEYTVMVGDHPIDVQTAHNAGTRSVAVLYGFSTEDELCQAGADLLIERFSQLCEIGDVLF